MTAFRAAIPWAVARHQLALLDSHDTPRIADRPRRRRGPHPGGVRPAPDRASACPAVLYGDEIGMHGEDERRHASADALGPVGLGPRAARVRALRWSDARTATPALSPRRPPGPRDRRRPPRLPARRHDPVGGRRRHAAGPDVATGRAARRRVTGPSRTATTFRERLAGVRATVADGRLPLPATPPGRRALAGRSAMADDRRVAASGSLPIGEPLRDDVPPVSQDFVFGTLATDALRLAQLRAAAVGRPPRPRPRAARPRPGPADHGPRHGRSGRSRPTASPPTSRPTAADPAGSRGTATTRHGRRAGPDRGRPGTRWRGAIARRGPGPCPGSPTGTIVRYRLEAWSSTPARRTWAIGHRRRRRGARGRPARAMTTQAMFAPSTPACGRSAARAPFAVPRRSRARPGLAARRGHLPGLRRPLRDDRRRPVREPGHARRVLRRHAARRHPSGSTTSSTLGRHLHLAVAGLPEPVAPRLRRDRLPVDRAAPRAPRPTCASCASWPTRAGCGSCSTSSSTTCRRPIRPSRPRCATAASAEAGWFTFTDWPDTYLSFFGVLDHPQIDSDDPGARGGDDRGRGALAAASASTASGSTTRRVRRTRSGGVPGGDAGRRAGQRDHRRGRRDAGAPG